MAGKTTRYETDDTGVQKAKRSASELIGMLSTVTEKLQLLDKEFDGVNTSNLETELKRVSKIVTQNAEALGVEYERISDIQSALSVYVQRRKEANDLEEQEIVTLRKLKDKYEVLNKVQKSTTNILQTTLGIHSSYTKTFVGDMVKMSAASGGFGAAIKDIAGTVGRDLKTAIFSMGGLANISSATLKKMAEASIMVGIEFNRSTAEFYKATGATQDYNSAIADLGSDYRTFGVNIEISKQAFTSLYAGMPRFTQLTDQNRRSLANLTAKLDVMGISSDTTAKTLDILMASLGQSTNVTDRTTRELVATAQALGMVPEVIFNDFVASQDFLGAWGEKSIAIFKKVAGQSKATSISVGSLMSMAERMDTFSGAAEVSARMSAFLGPVGANGLELMAGTPEQRILSLRRMFDQAGVSLASLNNQERKMLAETIGMAVPDFNKFLTTPTERLRQMSYESLKVAASQEEIRKATERATNIGQKFTRFFESFAVAFGIFARAADWLAGALNTISNGPGGKWIMGGLGIASVVALGGSFISLTLKAVAAAKAITAIGAAVAAAGAAGAAGGIPSLMRNPKGMVKSIPIGRSIAAPMPAAAGLSAFGKTLGIAALAVVALGAALYMTGKGIQAGAEGLERLSKLDAKNLKEVSGCLYTFAGAYATMGAAGILSVPAAAAFGVLSAGIWLLSKAINSLDSTAATSLSGVFSSLGNLATLSGELVLVAESIQKISTAIAGVPALPAVSFGNAVNLTTNGNKGGASTSNGTSSQPTIIKLMLDEKELGSVVCDLVGRYGGERSFRLNTPNPRGAIQ